MSISKKINYFYIISTILVVLLLFFMKGPFVDHLKFSDQDHVHLYNALLFNSLEKQEYFDHPGFSSFFFLSIWINLFNFLGFIEYSNISTIKEVLGNNQQIEQNIKELIYLSRFFNLFVLINITIIFFLIVKKFLKNNFIAYLLNLVFITSLAFYNKLIIIRTEDLSILFLLLSFYFLLMTLEKINPKKNLYQFLSTIMIVLSLAAKIQSFLVIIFFPIIIIFLKKYFNTANNNTVINNNFRILLIFSLPVFILFLLIVLNTSYFFLYYKNYIQYFSFYYQILILLFLLTIIHYKNFNSKIKERYYDAYFYLLGFSLAIILIFIHPSSKIENITAILFPIEKMAYHSNLYLDLINSQSKNITTFAYLLLTKIKLIINFYELNFINIIILLFLILNFYLILKKKYYLILLSFVFFIISMFSLAIYYARVGGFIPLYYELYYTPFLLISLIFPINYILKKNLNLITLILILFISFNFFEILNSNESSGIHLDFCNSKESNMDKFYSSIYCD